METAKGMCCKALSIPPSLPPPLGKYLVEMVSLMHKVCPEAEATMVSDDIRRLLSPVPLRPLLLWMPHSS